eukprot:SAG31_NODE_10861_length_1089_cov_1.620202_1_plen_150_part_00
MSRMPCLAWCIVNIKFALICATDHVTFNCTFVQTDAPINHGNSGGALLDSTTGKVCGITNSMISNNDGNIGIGFAITADTVRKLLADQLKNGDLPPPPSLGGGGDGYGSSSGLVLRAPQVGKEQEPSDTATFRRFVPRTGLLTKGDDGF